MTRRSDMRDVVNGFEQHIIGMLVFPRLTQLDMTGPYGSLGAVAEHHGSPRRALPRSGEDRSRDDDRAERDLFRLSATRCGDGARRPRPARPHGRRRSDRIPATAGGPRQICDLRLHWLASSGRGRSAQGQARDVHWAAIEHLAPLGAIAVHERVVVDGNIVTGAGVASGIDFALALAAILEGEAVAREIQLQIEYDPAPPFNSGSPRTASSETAEAVRRRFAPLNSSAAMLFTASVRNSACHSRNDFHFQRMVPLMGQFPGLALAKGNQRGGSISSCPSATVRRLHEITAAMPHSTSDMGSFSTKFSGVCLSASSA